MAWVRLDESFPEHPKVMRAGGDAAWLHVCAIAYCNRNLTDGRITPAAVTRLSDRKSPLKLAATLVKVGLWEQDGTDFRLHDYHHYNPSRAEVEAQRAKQSEAKAAAGRLGGIASGVARRKHGRSTDEAEGQAGWFASATAEGKRNEAPTRPDPTRPVSDQAASRVPPPTECPGGGGMPVDNRVDSVATEYARMAVTNARGVTNAKAYRRKAESTCKADPELHRLLCMFPTAPASAVAAWLHGDKGSQQYYPRTDELPTTPTGDATA